MSGWLTNGMTAATLPLTGAETFPLDTNAANGAQPQSEAATLFQLKAWLFGNSNVPPTASMFTASCTGAGGTSTATLNAGYGVLTTAALTTVAAASHVITLTNSVVTANSLILANVGYGTATTGEPAIHNVSVATGTAVITIRNDAAAAPVNGTLKVFFLIIA